LSRQVLVFLDVDSPEKLKTRKKTSKKKTKGGELDEERKDRSRISRTTEGAQKSYSPRPPSLLPTAWAGPQEKKKTSCLVYPFGTYPLLAALQEGSVLATSLFVLLLPRSQKFEQVEIVEIGALDYLSEGCLSRVLVDVSEF
jgi:hypothetical protein